MTISLMVEKVEEQSVKSAVCIKSFNTHKPHLSNAAEYVNQVVKNDQKVLNVFQWSTVVSYDIENSARRLHPYAISSKGAYTWFLMARYLDELNVQITIARVEYSYE